MGYVDTGVAGRTELRIHGVSGTAPADLLGHPHVQQVTGDRYAGVFRRVWEHRQHAGDTDGEHLEGYSWGGLTSGSWARALWLLLLPFMLLNVAYYMAPRVPPDRARTSDDGPAESRLTAVVGEGAQRVLALSLTVTMVLTTVTVAMDLAGWQCSRDSARCQGRWGPALLDQPSLHQPGLRLVASAVFPLAVIGLLWWLGRKTWQVAESVDVDGAAASPGGWRTPLEDRAMWNGEVPVARLRALHVTAALATLSIFLTAPFVARPRAAATRLFAAGWRDDGHGPAAVLLLVSLAVLGFAVVMAGLPRYDRDRPRPDGDAAPGRPRVWEPKVAYATCGLVLLAGVNGALSEPADAVVRRVATRPAPGAPVDISMTGQLPWLNDMTLVTFAVQLLTLLVVLAVCLVQSRGQPWARLRLPDQAPEPAPPDVAWRGCAQAVFAALAWVLLGGLAAAFIWRAAAAFGNPQGPRQASGPNQPTPLILGQQFFWAALAALALAAVVVVIGLGAARSLKKAVPAERDRVVLAYPRWLGGAPGVPATGDPHQVELRRDAIAAAWANATVTTVARAALMRLAQALAAIILVGAALFLVNPDLPQGGWLRRCVTAGGLVLTAAVLGLVYVGRRAYENPQFRRTVGILWDLGTFWPRATHPLAPPCYAERTVPDLLRRIELIHRSGGQVLLSAHSQGSVIAATVVAQMRTPCARNVALLTYGCPLRRLYAVYFPAYFGVPALLRVGELLERGGGQPPEDPWSRQRRGGWPWLNQFRLSDPIGGEVFVSYPAVESAGLVEDFWPQGAPPAHLGMDQLLAAIREQCRGEAAPPATFENLDVDWQLVDPRFAKADGDGAWPRADGHSGYPDDPAFPFAVGIVWERRGPYLPEQARG